MARQKQKRPHRSLDARSIHNVAVILLWAILMAACSTGPESNLEFPSWIDASVVNVDVPDVPLRVDRPRPRDVPRRWCRDHGDCADEIECTIDECSESTGLCGHRLDLSRCECDPGCARTRVGGDGGTPFTPVAGGAVVVEPESGALTVRRIAPTQDLFWLANTAESTVSKWDAVTERELARYRVGLRAGECRGRCCSEPGCNQPATVALDDHDNVYVASHALGTSATVTKVLQSRTDCVDRDMNGIIETSDGPLNVLPFGKDECVAWTANLGVQNAGLRAIALDPRRDPTSLWVGGCSAPGSLDLNESMFQLSALTGSTLQRVSYGACLDASYANGTNWLWQHVAGWGLTRLDLSVNPPRMSEVQRTGEGLMGQFAGTTSMTIDGLGHIWLARGTRDAFGYELLTGAWTYVPLGGDAANGISGAITTDDNSGLYVAGANTIYSWDGAAFRAHGEIDRAAVNRFDVPEAVGLREVSAAGADRQGRIWMVSSEQGPLVRFDPQTRSITGFAAQHRVGWHSDFTGSGRRATLPIAQYTDTYEEPCDAHGRMFEWRAELPPNTAIVFVFRRALDRAGLANATPVVLADSRVDASPVRGWRGFTDWLGNWYSITVEFYSARRSIAPKLYEYRVGYEIPHCI